MKKPKWLKSKAKTEAKKEAEDETETRESGVNFVFEEVELYKIDDNTEEFFNQKFK